MQQRIPLAAIAPGETVRVAEIHVEGALRRRLFDLGLIPQTLVSCRFAAPAGSPMAFTVRGAALALRTADAQEIFVERVS